MSSAPVSPGEETALIVKIPDVRGLFPEQGPGVHELSLSAADFDVLSLVQFRLPASARIEELRPPPMETRRSLSRLVITVAAD